MVFRLRLMARELHNCIQAANVVTDTGVKIPVLMSTHIAVENGRATFTATNTDQTVSCRAACEGEGATLLNTAMLLSKAAVLKQDAPVDFVGSDDGRTVTASQGRAKWVMPCLPPDDFPHVVVSPVNAEPVKLNMQDVFGNLQAARDGIDPRVPDIRQGVYFDFEDGLRLVGCAKATVHVAQVPFEKIEYQSFVMPEKAVLHLESLFKGVSTAEIRVSDLAFSIDSDGIFFKSKLLEGSYVPYRRIIPESYAGTVLVDATEFSNAVKRTLAIRDDGKSLKLKIRFDEDISITARNVDGEESEDMCRADITGEPMEFTMSNVKLLRALASLDCDVLKIQYTARDKAIFFSPNGSTRENFRAVAPMMF